jgi:hypothetical protein
VAPTPIRLKGRDVRPHKAVVAPRFGAPTVLTREPWTFVSLWLKKEKQQNALFYWDQGYEFYRASIGLPPQSAPLLLYYSYMNATKALLAAKGISFDPYHGVKKHGTGSSSRVSLKSESVRFLPKGVVPALSTYYSEPEPARTHSLQELFFNMAFIHRSYCLTYTSQTDMFVPLKNCAYVVEKSSGQTYFTAQLSRDFAPSRIVKRLPASLQSDPSGRTGAIRSVKSVSFARPGNPTQADIYNLVALHRELRQDVHYINGAETLWYAKTITSGPRRLARQPPTIVLAAMHWLSEICRYRPLELASHLSGQKNWLLSEFIEMSPSQFIDEIAAELTGYQFLVPNVRPAT